MKLIKKYISKYTTNDEELEVVIYGLYNFILSVCGIFLSVLLGIITRKTFEVIIFLLFFIPLRIFAGGYHARSTKRCMILSSLVMVGVIFMYQIKDSISTHLEYMNSIEVVLFVIACIIIYILAPVDNENKRLYIHEIKRYRMITRIIVFGYTFLFFVSKGQDNQIYYTILISVIFESMSLISGKTKDYISSK